ncbi:ketopantoate reductase family protein [Clostridium sp. DL1XJH146]
MKIAIIGAGVMGSLVGSMLKKSGTDVWLVDTDKQKVKAIQQDGLKITLNDKVEDIKITAVNSATEINEKMDVIIFLVKGVYTDVAAKGAKCLADEKTYVMTLQNGIGNVDVLAKYYNKDKILYGILEFAGKLIEPGHIKSFVGENSKICFGSTTKTITEEMVNLKDLIEKSGLKVIISEDIDGEVWLKLKNNSVNVLFGLLRLPIGKGLSIDGTGELVHMVRNEVMEVAKANGIKFSDDFVNDKKQVSAISPELYEHIPSTAQDMKDGRITEVAYINGFIYKEGLRLGVPTPYNELIYKMVKVIEKSYKLQY